MIVNKRMLLLTLLWFSECVHSAHEGSISIPLNDWTSQRVISKAVGNLLRENGIPVSFVEINEDDQWGALRKGIVHFQLEAWQPSYNSPYQLLEKQNYITDYGTHSAQAREEWWYPDYVEDMCPGLPDWRALNQCASLFSKTGKERGVYYTGPWQYFDEELVQGLNLKFDIKRFSTEKELWTKLSDAIEQHEPIIILNWTPNWTDQRINGKFVEFPEYHLKCETDPSWGQSHRTRMDCGNVAGGWLKKIGWSGLEKSHPCVDRMLKKVDLSSKMIAEASALVVTDSNAEDIAAQIWATTFKDEINSWLPKNCKA